LRAAVPRLHVLHLSMTPHQVLERVASRTDHFYPPSLVASQFQALEEPGAEPGVLVIDACLPLDEVASWAMVWLSRPWHS